MSQPKEFGPNEVDPLLEPLTNVEQALQVFHAVERKKSDWLMGIEYEMFGQIDNQKTPLPYEGEISITTLYKTLAKDSINHADPMEPIYEGPNIVALSCARAIIALEPGGQIEIAAKPHAALSDVVSIFSDVVKEIKVTANRLGIDVFALGLHPVATRDEMAQVKKARYHIMRNYMKSLDGLGLDMMTRSCAIQINLDFSNEADMVRKTRLGAMLAPFFSLLCSSTAFKDGKQCEHAIERGHVWRKTDPARTGIPSIIFERDFGYRRWIEMVLDVPMYFIRRGNEYHDASHASFRSFMKHGFNGHTATVRDFVDHMTTVFTDIRLKPILELRSADSLPVPFVNALTALSWALFYNHNACDEVFALFDGLTHKELIATQNQIIDSGRDAQFRGEKVFTVAEKLLSIAQKELDKLAAEQNNSALKNLLKPFAPLIEKNMTCADWIKETFPTLNQENLSALIKRFDPLNNPL